MISSIAAESRKRFTVAWLVKPLRFLTELLVLRTTYYNVYIVVKVQVAQFLVPSILQYPFMFYDKWLLFNSNFSITEEWFISAIKGSLLSVCKTQTDFFFIESPWKGCANKSITFKSVLSYYLVIVVCGLVGVKVALQALVAVYAELVRYVMHENPIKHTSSI